MNHHKNFKHLGFTLVELLIVVSLIGILAGITVSVLNPQRQRMNAEDGVRRANLAKMMGAIDAFFAGEGRYPSNKAEACPSTYMSACPDNSPTTGTTYNYGLASNVYGVVVTKSSSGCYKFRSDTAWGGKILDCTDCSVSTSTCIAPVIACGDHTCNGSETCSSCPGDCGVCAAVCGDTICNGSETCSSCPSDCGSCATCSHIGEDCDYTSCCPGEGLCEDYSMGRCNCQYSCSL